MVDRTSKNAAHEIDKLNEKDSFAVPDISPRSASQQRSRHNKEFPNDDLIVSLSNAYENKRARQVGEWERAQVRNVYAA